MTEWFLTRREAAQMLACSVETVKTQVRRGRMLTVFGLIPLAEIDRYWRKYRGKPGKASPAHPGHGRRAR